MSTIADLPADVKWLHEPEVEEELDFFSTGAAVNFFMPWGVRKDFIEVVGGLPQQFTVGTITYTRIIPLEYPDYDNVYAYRVRLRGAGSSRVPAGAGIGIEYDWAIATVWFATPQWRYDGDYPLVTQQQQTGSEYVTRPGTAYIFPSDSLKLSQNIGVRVVTEDIALTFHQVQGFNQALYRSLSGKVNSTEFYGAAAGTVLYTGPATTGQRTVGNTITWEITHRFAWRSVPHNQIMRPDGTAFEAPEDDNGDPIYAEADLNAIWAG